MTSTERMTDLPPMAEMTGSVLAAEASVRTSTGGDAALAVAAELAAEGRVTTGTTPAAPMSVPAGLAALEAETEE